MIRLVLLLSLATSSPATPQVPCPVAPERMFLGVLATNVAAYVGRTVEVCGVLQAGADRSRPSERVLHATGSTGDPYWFLVEDESRQLGVDGSESCVAGIPRRRDGLTPGQAWEMGRPNSYSPDGLQNPDYVLYPIRCELNGPALG